MGLQLTDLGRFHDDFQTFCDDFMPAFGRTEVQQESQNFLRGLLRNVKRKNGWQLSEDAGNKGPDKTQRLVRTARCDEKAAWNVFWQKAQERFSTPDGVFVVDETGFPKAGKHSVGVKHQYCPPLGKRSNCQIGVFLSYVSDR